MFHSPVTRRVFRTIRRNFSDTHYVKPERTPLTRFNEFPVDLFRIYTPKIRMRERQAQIMKNSLSFDFVGGPDGLVHPMTGVEFYKAPNGISLIPSGNTFWHIVAPWRGKPLITYIPRGTKIDPSLNLVLIRERNEHYSLQTTQPITLKELNAKLTTFMNQFETLSKDEYIKRYPVVFDD